MKKKKWLETWMKKRKRNFALNGGIANGDREPGNAPRRKQNHPNA